MTPDLDWLTGDPLGLDAKASETEPFERCAVQLGAVIDEVMAAMLRGLRTGQSRSLREQGFTAAADELEHWRHD